MSSRNDPRSRLIVPQFRHHKLQRLANILRAVVGLRIVEGGSYRVELSETNLLIQVKRQSGGDGSGGRTKMVLVSYGAEHLVCTDPFGATVNIAKPAELRHSVATTTIDSVVYSHPTYNVATQQRTTTWGTPTQTETQVVQPRYIVGDEIWAESCQTGVSVGGVALTYIDSNEAARAWARVYADKIFVGSQTLAVGTSSGTVTGLALSATPQEVFLQVANDLIVATPLTPYTTDGFSFELSGATMSADARLAYMIYL